MKEVSSIELNELSNRYVQENNPIFNQLNYCCVVYEKHVPSSISVNSISPIPMRVLTAQDLSTLLSPPAVVEALKTMFNQGAEVPKRHHHSIQTQQGSGTLLIMPAWTAYSSAVRYAGVKLVTVYPDNPANNVPSIQGPYFLFDKTTGTPLAVMDGSILTLFRTAAASVLAASYLARKQCKHLLMVGTGRLAPYIIKTYLDVLPVQTVFIWGRNTLKAINLAESLNDLNAEIIPEEQLSLAVERADIISCATMSTEPLIQGNWLKPGQHIDLIGSYTPEMRETDDLVIQKASVFVDTKEGVLAEAGDLIQPLIKGVFSDSDIKADLEELCRGKHAGRNSEHEITLFKSVGTALEDLAIAQLAYELSSDDLRE